MLARSLFLSCTLAAALVAGCNSRPAAPPQSGPGSATPAVQVTGSPSAENSQTIIQIALLLDTSSSMDGLIEQAKSQLWKIVNELSQANQAGKNPVVMVAVYEYGKQTLDGQGGYIRKVNDFTTELDGVSEALFQLKCNGGDEYCGWVIDKAVQDLQWSNGPKVYKVIFIAGNEPFTQGPVDYHKACDKARQKGVFVNTIYCGNKDSAEQKSWRDGAIAGDGRSLSIDQNRQVAQVAAPQDKELADLGAKLNQSYIPYGAAGEASSARQSSMDQCNASLGGSVMSERVVSKASKSYSNENWDLVDAVNKGKVKLSDVKKEDLPAPMQSMAPAEREAMVAAKQKDRADTQARIQQLSKERSTYLAQRTRSTGSIDEAVLSAVKTQAATKGYKFEK